MKQYALLDNDKVYINEEKGTVVYKLDLYRDDRVLYEINTKVFYPYRDNAWHLKVNALDCIYNEFVGKAKCSPEDTFDKEKGIKIARAKAVIKATDKALKELKDLLDSLPIIEKEINKQIEHMTREGSRYSKAIAVLEEAKK